MEPVLQLLGVAVTFGAQPVLRGINLSFLAGETVCVIGESGCGKTVLLKLLVGLQTPTTGDVKFQTTSIPNASEKDLVALRQKIGFLFQGAALFDSLTVKDNIAFGPRARGVKESEIDTLVVERLKDVGLSPDAAVKMPSELSGGMKKRVGLARALALDPDVMLYDEPTTGLDPLMTDTINELILSTRQRRPITSVVVTHEMRTVRTVADRVVMLTPLAKISPDEPQVIFDGPAKDLESCPDERVRKFVGNGR